MKPYHHTEAQLETLFRIGVTQRLGGMVVKLAPTQAGVPDRLVLLPGHPGWPSRIELVELKTVVGRLAPIQREWHRRAAALGVVVTTLYGKPDIDAWVRDRATAYDHLLEVL